MIVAYTGTPVGSVVVVDFTTTNTSGAVDASDDNGDGIDNLDLGNLEGVVITFALLNPGYVRDGRAEVGSGAA